MEQARKITVFGATGKIGSDLIQLFSDAKIPVTAVTRNLERAIPLPFVEWHQADMAHEEQLIPAIAKGGGVFLTSGPSPDFVKDQTNVIRAAQRARAAHLVKLSSGEADACSPLFIPRLHGLVEAALTQAGIPYTILRSNGMMQNWLGDLAESVRKDRKFHESTGDGKRAYVDKRDVAEVAFNCLTKPENHYAKTYFLTGGEAVNYNDVAAAISSVLQQPVAYVPISLEDARREMEQQNLPPALIETFIAYDTAQRNGEKALVTDSVSKILGRPPRTIDQFFADHADCFR
ncbi:NmrA family NAD(P)-binding protein [Spirosoma litoris]